MSLCRYRHRRRDFRTVCARKLRQRRLEYLRAALHVRHLLRTAPITRPEYWEDL